MYLCPYLSFNGQCEAAFKFYEKCLGGTIESLLPYAGSPMADQDPTDWGQKVMHGEIRLGDHLLMGADMVPDQYEEAKGTHLLISKTLPKPRTPSTPWPKMEPSRCPFKKPFGLQDLAC